MRAPSLAALAALLSLALPVQAADFSDPTWPCVQRKVPRLSVGLMWPEPPSDAAPAEAEPAVEDLAARLALRRLPVEEVASDVAGFAQSHGADRALLGHVFVAAFERLDGTRSAVIKGIGAYSLEQIALSERIDAARDEMAAEMAEEAPDFDRVDALEAQIDWDARIFTDRQRSLTYVCETPVLLEKRLYSIAQMLQATAE